VDDFEESPVTAKMIAKTAPLKQWQMARESRRRIKYVFDKEGIRLPFPHRTLFMEQDN
jgi:small-conductance mechanosensitive channel